MLRFQDIAKITVEVIKDSRDDEFSKYIYAVSTNSNESIDLTCPACP